MQSDSVSEMRYNNDQSGLGIAMHGANFQDEIEKQKRLEKLARRILGVNADAEQDDLKKAYRKLAMKYHPDRRGNTHESRICFENIKAAYEFLSSGGLYEPLGNSDIGQDEERNDGFNTKNSWGYFLWWRDKYFY